MKKAVANSRGILVTDEMEASILSAHTTAWDPTAQDWHTRTIVEGLIEEGWLYAPQAPLLSLVSVVESVVPDEKESYVAGYLAATAALKVAIAAYVHTPHTAIPANVEVIEERTLGEEDPSYVQYVVETGDGSYELVGE